MVMRETERMTDRFRGIKERERESESIRHEESHVL